MTYKIESARGGQTVVTDVEFPIARALWVGTEGDVEVKFAQGGTAIYKNVRGTIELECVMVIGAGTTASDITTMV